MTQPQDKMRAEFEAWAKDRGYQRDELGRSTISLLSPDYFNPHTEESWQAWQAACAQKSAQSQQDALDAARARWVLKNATYVTGEFTDQLGIVQSFYWDAELGENIAEEIDLAIATQGASNV